MNAVVTLASAVLMVLIATGTYNLQWYLERTDYERHFED
jgi:hypothetical protein